MAMGKANDPLESTLSLFIFNALKGKVAPLLPFGEVTPPRGSNPNLPCTQRQPHRGRTQGREERLPERMAGSPKTGTKVGGVHRNEQILDPRACGSAHDHT